MKKIIINGKEAVFHGQYVSYRQLCFYTFNGTYKKGKILYTVTFRHGVNGAMGSLIDNEKVELAEGMIINVSNTSNA